VLGTSDTFSDVVEAALAYDTLARIHAAREQTDEAEKYSSLAKALQ